MSNNAASVTTTNQAGAKTASAYAFATSGLACKPQPQYDYRSTWMRQGMAIGIAKSY